MTTSKPAAGFELAAFGQRVALARRGAGLNQSELADLIGRSRASVTNIERGHAATSLPQVVVLADTLDVSVGWLMTGQVGDAPSELLVHLRKIRATWQRVLDGNRGLGWPEHAECVQMPRDFVRDIDSVLDTSTPDTTEGTPT